MTKSQHFMRIYYNFAEMCNDDFFIMTKVIKMGGCKKRPNVIYSQLENIDASKPYCEEYIQIMVIATEDTIQKAKWIVQKERGQYPTLPGL